MSMLNEPRRKRRICLDPQNLTWKNDTGKFGVKMMQKMGWEDGKGLGVNEQGMTENLKIKANHTQSGFKAKSETVNYGETWLSHHDEFSSLLGSLKATKAKVEEESSEDEGEVEEKVDKKVTKEKQSIEEKMRSSNKRFFYKKVLMKDLSRYSEKDKSAVIGIRKNKPKEPTPEPETKEEEKKDDKVVTSQVSVNDYFASKMAKFYAKKQGIEIKEEKQEVEEITEIKIEPEIDSEKERRICKAEKKAKKLAEESPEDEGIDVEDDEEERKRRKAEKKARKLAKEQESQENQEMEIDPEEERRRRKAEKKARKLAEAQENEEECVPQKKKRKNKEEE